MKESRIKAHHYSKLIMGCHFVITAVDHCPEKAWQGIRAGVAEMERIEALISSWRYDSETTAINVSAGLCPVRVSDELYGLIKRSLQISDLTSGAFDISGSLSRNYWDFNCGHGKIPDEDQLKELKSLMNYKMIRINESDSSVFLEKEGMQIGFGGICKGYAALRASQVMQSMGVQSGMINAAGDLFCWGRPPQKEYWTINISDPDAVERVKYAISIPSGSVVTSGCNEKFTIVDGITYSHIIDPRMGMPVTESKSVSVVCPDPEFADAMATSLSVLGKDDGLALVNQLNGVECVITDQENNRFYSNNFSI